MANFARDISDSARQEVHSASTCVILGGEELCQLRLDNFLASSSFIAILLLVGLQADSQQKGTVSMSWNNFSAQSPPN